MYGFISRNLKHGLVYSGKPETLDQMCDPEEAQARYTNIAKHYPSKARKEVELVVYGKKVVFSLPLVEFAQKPQEGIEVTDELYSYIIEQAKVKRISDNILGIRQELVRGVTVLKLGNIIVFGIVTGQETLSEPTNMQAEQQAMQQETQPEAKSKKKNLHPTKANDQANEQMNEQTNEYNQAKPKMITTHYLTEKQQNLATFERAYLYETYMQKT